MCASMQQCVVSKCVYIGNVLCLNVCTLDSNVSSLNVYIDTAIQQRVLSKRVHIGQQRVLSKCVHRYSDTACSV